MQVSSLRDRLLRGQSFRQWFIEFLKFCTVGLASYVVDVGLFNLLAYHLHIDFPGDDSMVAKVVSVSASVIFSWLINRAWTFRDKSDKAATQELLLFVAINIVGLLIALGCLWVSRYLLDMTSQLADNVSANVVGLMLGTAFRYICYRYVVFTKDDDDPKDDGGR